MRGDLLILGLGASGAAAARYAAARPERFDGIAAVDAAGADRLGPVADELSALGVEVRLGADAVTGRFSLCVASPGIPPHAPLMRSAAETCDEIVSEIEFAFRESASPWVAITGTNGKTTTTALVEHLLTAGGVSAKAVGNIGTPAIEAVSESDDDRVLVAEVSSFQLAHTDRFHPRVAVLLNLTPDHIDWHGSLERYAEDKGRVFAAMGADDTAVVDVDDPGAAPFAARVEAQGVRVVRVSREAAIKPGASVVNGVLTLHEEHGDVPLLRADELRIRGPHNASNALAAAAAAHAMGVKAGDITRGLSTFAPIEHRLEPVCVACGAEWFNDSKATNPDAVFKAIAAFAERPLVLLLGGRNKGNDFSALARETEKAVRAVVLFGEARAELAAAFNGREIAVREARDLASAVAEAAALAGEGDAVVLSPACASFDEFDNYEQRGRRFKDLVAGLKGCQR